MTVFDVPNLLSDDGVVGRLCRLPLRLIPVGTQVPVLHGRLKGKKWIIGAGTHGCWLGSYEHAKQKHFSELVGPGDVVYDLGAHVGFYSLLASVLVGPSGKVYSFEPCQRNISMLKTILELNSVTNCRVIEAAVSISTGWRTFEATADSYSGHLTLDKEVGMAVKTVELDRFMQEDKLRPPTIIKCDIEGEEFNALLGASETIKKHRPAIFLATHGSAIHAECVAFLNGIGYHLSSLDKLPVSDTSELFGRHSQPLVSIR